MKIPVYPFVKRPESSYYEFFSEGPNGSLKKVVEYFRLREMTDEVFNLAFGDWDETSHRISDLSVSNNTDKDKVLATVAATIADFMRDHPDAIIIATGSTPSRNRLYQIGIAKILAEISQTFEVHGFTNDCWQPFQRGVNYSAFLLKAR